MKGSLKCSESEIWETRVGEVQHADSVWNILAAHPAMTSALKQEKPSNSNLCVTCLRLTKR